ncbi:GH25 family lysozyme [Arthrobacter psychrolactophilus]
MGSRFVYAKATEGSSFVDRSRSSHLTGARSVGMLTGAYHFALPGDSTATRQADHFVNNGGSWINDGKTLAPLLDIENNPYTDPYGSQYLGNECYNLSPAAMVIWIKDFSAQVQARTGRLPVIYTNYYWWQACTGNSQEFTSQDLHIAAYGASSPWIPGGWSDYSFWQYSSTGPFAGDSNVWNGTVESLKAFASKNTSPVSPPSIQSGADVVAADSVGTLWNYPATSSATLGSRVKIGAGWQNFRSINVVDWNADGIFDLLAQWNNGVLNVYRGLPGGGFQEPSVLGTGWAQNQLSIGFWISTSQYPQILSRTPSGALQLWHQQLRHRNQPGATNRAGVGRLEPDDGRHRW